MTFDLLEDQEPAQEVTFPVSHGTDARFFKAFAFKPTREGSNMSLLVSAFTGGQFIGSAQCQGVTVSQ